VATADEGTLAYSDLLEHLRRLGANGLVVEIEALVARGEVRRRGKTRDRPEVRYASPLSPEEQAVAAARVLIAAVEPALLVPDTLVLLHKHASSHAGSISWAPDNTEGAQEATRHDTAQPIPLLTDNQRSELRQRAEEILRLCNELSDDGAR
jgi:cytochrome c-type biogenesis protein CcmH/NrfG